MKLLSPVDVCDCQSFVNSKIVFAESITGNSLSVRYGVVVVKALCYKPEGSGFDTR
jgi:hypothetical protein